MTDNFHIDCPCTTFEQDEDCPVGYPSLLCSACEGKGVTPIETVVALAAEMLKVAEQVDELEDPFAAWESIELLKSKSASLVEENERLERERAEQWRLRREADADRDMEKAVSLSFKLERDALREALQGLEWACEQLAETRTMKIYDAMIEGGQADAMLSLDGRRRAARAALGREG